MSKYAPLGSSIRSESDTVKNVAQTIGGGVSSNDDERLGWRGTGEATLDKVKDPARAAKLGARADHFEYRRL